VTENDAPAAKRPGRNEPCHCGSGKKYKQCCLANDEEADRRARAEAAAHAAPPAPPEGHAEGHAKRTPPPRRATDQPWKSANRNVGSFHKVSGPRKIGSS